jgi:hypothetical protein
MSEESLNQIQKWLDTVDKKLLLNPEALYRYWDTVKFVAENKMAQLKREYINI